MSRSPSARVVTRLAVCQGLAYTLMTVLTATTTLAGHMLAARKSLATLPLLWFRAKRPAVETA